MVYCLMMASDSAAKLHEEEFAPVSIAWSLIAMIREIARPTRGKGVGPAPV